MKTPEEMAEEATRKFVEEHGLYGQMTARYRTAAEAFLAGYKAAMEELEKREREAFEAGLTWDMVDGEDLAKIADRWKEVGNKAFEEYRKSRGKRL